MKTKDKKELFEKTVDELKTLLAESRNELFNLKLSLAQRKLNNVKEVFFMRKKIAMILTAIREKELKGAIGKIEEIVEEKPKGVKKTKAK